MTPPVRLFLVDRLVGSLPFGNNFVKKLEVTLTCNEGRIRGGAKRARAPPPRISGANAPSPTILEANAPLPYFSDPHQTMRIRNQV